MEINKLRKLIVKLQSMLAKKAGKTFEEIWTNEAETGQQLAKPMVMMELSVHRASAYHSREHISNLSAYD
jgi:hypothetical protein